MQHLHDVAIIGAGIAGLACAQALHQAGRGVRVYDKARGGGGRISTRRQAGAPANQAPWQFDHGAQYFTARDPAFIAQVAQWQAAGVVAPWLGKMVRITNGSKTPVDDGQLRYVGTPTMSSIAKAMVKGIELLPECRISNLGPLKGKVRWRLNEENGQARGDFNHIAIAIPAPQANTLLAGAPTLLTTTKTMKFAHCWAVMVVFENPLPIDFDAAFIDDSTPLSWIARDSSKPGRPAQETWVLHASADWSEKHLEVDPDTALPTLMDAFGAAVGIKIPVPLWAAAHRWRYARCLNPLGQGSLYDPSKGLGACGDWAADARVEGAWLSGCDLAKKIRAD